VPPRAEPIVPPAKQQAQRAAAPVVEPVAPVKTAAPAAPVEWPVASMAPPEAATPSEPEPATATATATTIPAMAPASALPASGPAAELKGDMIMTDVLETAKTYADEAKNRMQSAFNEMNEKSRTVMDKSARAFEELGELTKGNLEAVVESSKIAAKGFESLGQEAAEFGRRSFEKTSATMKNFAAIKTPAEFFQLQSELMSQVMDSFATEASKSSEKMLKLASDISQPISNRVSVVTEKMKSLAA
jgi:phasin family protein